MTSAPSSITSPPDTPRVELFTARSGARSLRVDGKALHSPYDPRREAERFVAEMLGSESPAVVVLLGEGLGHVGAAVASAFPGARVITVTFSEEVFRLSGAATEGWHPGLRQTVGAFLRARLGELDIEGLRVLEWPASARAFPGMSRAAAQAMRSVAQELNGSFATTCAAAGTWLRNSIANFLGIDTVLAAIPGRRDRPVVVAAPGPSLEQAAAVIAPIRSLVDLWALPSSCPFLAGAGLEPDLVVLTDPGYYAMHHLRCARTRAPVAMPLSAARGSWGLAGGSTAPPVFMLSQPVFYERALLRAAGLRCPEITPHGTVAATAIELARSATNGPVIVAGLDMCMRDLMSHARPNAFDTLLHLAASRTAPHTGLWFQRAAAQQVLSVPGAGEAKVSPALRTYAGWFDEAASLTNVYRLLPSPVVLRGMRDVDAGGLGALLETSRSLQSPTPPGPARASIALPRPAEKKRIVRGLLGEWAAVVSAAPPAFAWEAGPGDPGTDPTALSICYMVQPRLLMESRRLHRLGRRDDAQEAARTMAARTGAVLRQLADTSCDER